MEKIRRKLGRVLVFVSGGDKISADEILKMQQVIGVPIINGYGNNELTGAAVISPVYAGKPAAIGIPMKGIVVAAFDEETDKQLPDGQTGELRITTDSMFVKYIDNDEETKHVKRTDENGVIWVNTNDMGFVDEDGYVYIMGRTQRLIKRNAYKIAPITIENIISKLPEIKDCVVVGVPDEIEREVPLLYVELCEEYMGQFPAIKEKIEAICQAEIPDYEIPKYILEQKIPYNNGKQAFKQLEKMGAEYVKGGENGFVTKGLLKSLLCETGGAKNRQ